MVSFCMSEEVPSLQFGSLWGFAADLVGSLCTRVVSPLTMFSLQVWSFLSAAETPYLRQPHLTSFCFIYLILGSEPEDSLSYLAFSSVSQVYSILSYHS